MADVHYHIERPGPRARYILEHVLGRMAGWSAEEVPDMRAFLEAPGPKLIYGHGPVAGAFRVAPQGLLEQEGLRALDPAMGAVDGLPVLFPGGGDAGFDPFAASFWLLSRHEEYGPMPRDEHGRPRTEALHAARNGYLHRPLVDEWLLALVQAWRKMDPRLPALRRRYGQVATMDVDNGAMYLGREWWRSIGASFRDLLHLRASRLRDRVDVLRGRRADPYAVHEEFLRLAEAHHAPAAFNFMAGGRSTHDHAVAINGNYMRALLARLAPRGELGLHPGYRSSDEPARIGQEKHALEALCGRPVTRSRQHFLRFRLPDTYRQLEALGIREEHSMGLADRPGFRAGTCTPYPFYDLGAERGTRLMVHPFAVMDSALCYHMQLAPAGAVEAACRMADAVRAVGGTFISVWHERFLSNYGDEAGWGGVAPAVLHHARP